MVEQQHGLDEESKDRERNSSIWSTLEDGTNNEVANMLKGAATKERELWTVLEGASDQEVAAILKGKEG